jgi:ADP-ribose pyrophosphatase YjhB (NUDIX family)
MDILKLFQYREKLKFVDIEKALKVRSNKLAYHLKKLTKKGILIKKDNYYSLSESSEYLIPYLSERESYLPVILIFIGNRKKAFLYKREKRPYQNKLSLPGGRILIGETLESATKRIMQERFQTKVKFKKLNSISFEQVRKSRKVIHSFILFFISAEAEDNLEFLDLENHKAKIIPSDYKLITEDFNKKTQINTIFSKFE